MTGLRERRRTSTRREIVEAALDLFEKNGFDSTTINDVAAAADVSPRTVFRHFATKEDIVFFGQSEETQRLAALLAEAPEGGDPVDTLVAVTRALVLTPGATPEQLVRGRRLVERVPSLRAFKRTLMTEIEELIADALAPARASRSTRLQVRLLAAVHVAALDVVMTSWMAAGARGTPVAELDTVENLLRRAFPPKSKASSVVPRTTFAAGEPVRLEKPTASRGERTETRRESRSAHRAP